MGNKPFETFVSDLDLFWDWLKVSDCTISTGRLFWDGGPAALLWVGKVSNGWRDSGKSCIGWQWARRGGWRRHSPFAAKWSKKPATLTFTPSLRTCTENGKTLFPNAANQLWERSGRSSSALQVAIVCLSTKSYLTIVFVCQVESWLAMRILPPRGQMCRCNCM